jgi:hypothetical protein
MNPINGSSKPLDAPSIESKPKAHQGKAVDSKKILNNQKERQVSPKPIKDRITQSEEKPPKKIIADFKNTLPTILKKRFNQQAHSNQKCPI